MKNALSLHQTAQARRLYHHFIHGGILNERDMARMGSYIEVRDTRISELEAELRIAQTPDAAAIRMDEMELADPRPDEGSIEAGK